MMDSFAPVANGQARTFESENMLEKWRWELRAWVRRSSAIYLPLIQFRKRHSDGSRKIFGRETELVIDSFPAPATLSPCTHLENRKDAKSDP